MAGYAFDYSKSNNALNAEADGKFPASVVAKKLKVPVALVKASGRAEWHHSSKFYNKVDYYDLAEVRAFIGSDEGQAVLASLKAAKAAPFTLNVAFNAHVKWLEWSGSRSRPQATEQQADGCTLTRPEGSQTWTILLADGRSLTKRDGTNGFWFFCEGVIEVKR